jgi:hypothetical protein
MVAFTLTTEEEDDARMKFEKIFADADFESQTGMPSVTQVYRAADEM